SSCLATGFCWSPSGPLVEGPVRLLALRTAASRTRTVSPVDKGTKRGPERPIVTPGPASQGPRRPAPAGPAGLGGSGEEGVSLLRGGGQAPVVGRRGVRRCRG